MKALLVQIISKPCIPACREAKDKQQQTKQSLTQEAQLADLQCSFSRTRHTKFQSTQVTNEYERMSQT